MRIGFRTPRFQRRLSVAVVLLIFSFFLLTAFCFGDRMHGASADSVRIGSETQLTAGSANTLPESDNRQIFSVCHSTSSFVKLVCGNVGGGQNRFNGRAMRVLFSFFMFAFCIECAGCMLSRSGDGLHFISSSQDITEKIFSFRMNN